MTLKGQAIISKFFWSQSMINIYVCVCVMKQFAYTHAERVKRERNACKIIAMENTLIFFLFHPANLKIADDDTLHSISDSLKWFSTCDLGHIGCWAIISQWLPKTIRKQILWFITVENYIYEVVTKIILCRSYYNMRNCFKESQYWGGWEPLA